MRCHLWDAALGSLPIWVVGRRRDWILIHPELPLRGECQEVFRNPPVLAQLPSQHMQGTWGNPGFQVPGSHLHPLFPLSALFFLKTTCVSKLVLEGRALPLVCFWLEIYFSVHVLCSCTWQSGVCSAVHSLANLAS